MVYFWIFIINFIIAFLTFLNLYLYKKYKNKCFKCDKISVIIRNSIIEKPPSYDKNENALIFDGFVFLDLEEYQALLLDAGDIEEAKSIQKMIDTYKIDDLFKIKE